MLQVKKLKTYSLLVADMVAITSDAPDVMTKMGKNHNDIAYNINEGGDEDDDDSVEAPEAPDGDAALARRMQQERSAGTRTSSRLAKEATAQSDVQEGAAVRERRQIDLMKRRNEERIRQLAKENRKKGGDDEKDLVDELETYRRTNDYPDVPPNQVKVDMASQCIILPICGNPVPFHISTIKNIVMPDDDSATLLRINFYTAGMAVGKDAPANMAKLVAKYAPYASFIRELTFRSLDGHNLTTVRLRVVTGAFLIDSSPNPFVLFSYLYRHRPSVRSLNFVSVRARRKSKGKRRPLSSSKKSLYELKTKESLDFPI